MGKKSPEDAGRRRRIMFRAFALMLAAVLLLPLVPYAVAYVGGITNPNPGADLWRQVRQREAPPEVRTQVQGVDTGVLINARGESWREFRMEQLIPWSGWFLGGMLVAIALFYLLRGRIRIDNGRSGILVQRFTVNQRMAHWFMAVVFTILGLTGLVLLYGRFVLIPLLGPEGFSVTAAACKEIHNLFGPIFPLAVLLILFYFVRGNGFRWVDFKWLAKGGGLLGGHASAGHFNMGQKLWFWGTLLFGLSLVASGFVLVFPNFGQGRLIMEWAHFSHGIAAVLFIGGAFAHSYIGTLGMEGALEAMTNGYVDANWAKEHHDLWYAQMEAEGKVGVVPERGLSESSGGPETAGG